MQPLSLEAFDSAPIDVSTPDATQHESYAEGYAAGRAAVEAEQSSLTAELVQCIADLQFKYEEVSADVTQSFHPFLKLLVEKVLPFLAADTFAAQVAGYLASVADENRKGSLAVSVNPGQIEAMHTAFAGQADNVTVVADPTLDQHAAWIRHDKTETLIDIDQILHGLHDIISNLDLHNSRIENHG